MTNEGMPERLKLTRVKRPPEEAVLPIHVSNFFSILSITKSQSKDLRAEKLTCTPSYFIGKFPTLQPNNSEYKAIILLSAPKA